MRILALETSGLSGSVAAIADGTLIELPLNAKQRSAQSLAPAIRGVLRQAGWQPTDVNLVAVTQGPGSFTGLRVGATTAKVFAYAAGAEVLGVNTLEVLARQVPPECAAIETVIDAHRQQLFVGRFERTPPGHLCWQGETELVEFDDWLQALSPDRWLCGPILEKLRPQLPDWVQLVSETCWQPRAAAVGQLAAEQYAAGRRGDIWQMLPFYGRASAAEEKRQGS
ncbi:MAG: tRNA (adenosine(37)-N6)-threonylcarbamoyltransferase complex dimerization subunit type 1 TsaB [Pirellulales bacterium]